MKKVLSIIALCLIAVLAGTIIVFSCVDKNYNLNLTKPDYIQISVSGTTGESYYADGDSEHKAVYDKVMSLYNDSYKQKIMSGIFSGVIFNKPVIANAGTTVTTVLNKGTFIIFNYNEEQTLMLNGKKYTDKTNPSGVKYKTLYVEVKDTTSITSFSIYVKDVSSTGYLRYNYSVQAKQANLYDYIQENFAK